MREYLIINADGSSFLGYYDNKDLNGVLQDKRFKRKMGKRKNRDWIKPTGKRLTPFAIKVLSTHERHIRAWNTGLILIEFAIIDTCCPWCLQQHEYRFNELPNPTKEVADKVEELTFSNVSSKCGATDQLKLVIRRDQFDE
jgi:hypothetical protein